MTYTTVGAPVTDVEKQENADVPVSYARKIPADVWWCRVGSIILGLLIFAGSVVLISFGGVNINKPGPVSMSCSIIVNGTVCTLTTVPPQYNVTIPCNKPIPPVRPDSLYDCFYMNEKLVMYKPPRPDWPALMLAFGIICVVASGFFLFCFSVMTFCQS